MKLNKLFRLPRFRSIRTRLVVSMALTCVLLLCIFGFLGIYQVSVVLKSDNEVILKEKVEALALKVNSELEMMEGYVDLYAKFAYQELTDTRALIHDRDYFNRYKYRMDIALNAMTSSNLNPRAVYYKFGRVYWPEDGIFIVKEGNRYVEYQATNLSLYSEDDISHVVWYYEPMKKGVPTWIAPYDNANIGDARIISYVIPIIVDGIEIGVTGMDYDLSDITDIAKKVNESENAYGKTFVLSADGSVYYHPDYEYGASMTQENASYLNIVKRHTVKGPQIKNTVFDFDFESKYVAVRELKNGMLIGVAVDKSEVNKSGISLLSKLLIAAAIAFALLLSITAMVAENIVQPILKLNHTARKISLNIYDENVDVKGHDELSDLALSIRNMKNHLQRYTEYIRSLAYIDSMTSAFNKTAYDRDTQDIDLKITAKEKVSFGLIVFDVNGLKKINDTFGHEAGNNLITDASDVIRRSFPKDSVYRIGGDEFLALLKGDDELLLYDVMCSQFDKELEAINIRNKNDSERPYTLTIAKGFVVFDSSLHSCVSDVFKSADSRMYANKVAMKAQRE